MTLEMSDMTCRLTPWNEKIIHVLLSPVNAPCKAPLVGIDGTPDTQLSFTCDEDASHVSMALKNLTARVDKATGTFEFLDANGAALLTSKEMSIKPATVSGEETHSIDVAFDASDPSEKFFGLGQHQAGWHDQRGQKVQLWHDYGAEEGEIIGIPYLLSSSKYGILFDNTSRGDVDCARENPEETRWTFEVGDCISFFVIAADEPKDFFEAFRLLCGETPLPPLYALGYIQCKQRYTTQDEVMAVAKTYREKNYPCDLLVVDWYHWKILGDMNFDPEFWPDPEGMNKELTEMGYHVMISCWPRFMKESQNYDELESNKWYMTDGDGKTVYGTPKDKRGALIDTTNPDAGRWYWDKIHENYGKKGFSSWWTDENEPDISPHQHHLHAGTGARCHNVYPMTHSKALYEGHRKDREDRCYILSRSAWYGAQRSGTTFWSSDIYPTWDVFARQIPTALNFCMSGFAWWSSDIGGWQPNEYDGGWGPKHDNPDLLLDTTDVSDDIPQNAEEYAEMYVRWFQFGAFCPSFRAHGTRPENEVWSYGKDAEKIMADYLELRYRLLPYIYSQARETNLHGTPILRPLWYDFPDDNASYAIKDQYMFGPSFLVAPVTAKELTSRNVYLPAGTDWYDFWTGARLSGGQTIEAEAPLEKLPLFVPAGSIIPMGEVIQHTGIPQRDIKLHVYEGKDVQFDLYQDDGISYAYENGDCVTTSLSWKHDTGTMTVLADDNGLFGGKEADWLIRHK